ncbi:hypothetical protein KFE25_003848 [Diacronema lutheri]|nr:hypothetical protein KFE25_003848 [Diacronema lutheri]
MASVAALLLTVAYVSQVPAVGPVLATRAERPERHAARKEARGPRELRAPRVPREPHAHANAGADEPIKVSMQTMTWALPFNPVGCGQWPPTSTRDHLDAIGVTDALTMGWTCAGGSSRVDGPVFAHDTAESSMHTCADWCETTFPAGHAIAGKWCCAWQPGVHGPSCSWTDGSPTYGAMDAQCVKSNDHSAPPEPCQESLAYEACALASPMDVPCVAGKHVLAVLHATAPTDCSESCAAMDTCAFSAYNAFYKTCELHSKCHRSTGAQRGAGDEEQTGSGHGVWQWYARLPPQLEGVAQTLNAPIGLSVAEAAAVHHHHSAPAPAMLGAALDTTVPYDCDTNGGKRFADAYKVGGDSPDTCSQICLPSGFWGPAAKRGVKRGYCADNGCGDFVTVRKQAGVPYSVYKCACPTSNASSARAQPP